MWRLYVGLLAIALATLIAVGGHFYFANEVRHIGTIITVSPASRLEITGPSEVQVTAVDDKPFVLVSDTRQVFQGAAVLDINSLRYTAKATWALPVVWYRMEGSPSLLLESVEPFATREYQSPNGVAESTVVTSVIGASIFLCGLAVAWPARAKN